MTSEKKRCFVIMPFSDSESHPEGYWTSHFEHFLKPLIQETGKCEAFRSQAIRGNITNEIIMNLIESDIVIADLTDYNPNVFWELGVRQSFKHSTITIAQEGTKVPFDIKTKGVHFYDQWHLNEEFKNKLKQELEDCCLHPEKPDSPILEAISGRGTLYHLLHKEDIKRRLKALISECEYTKERFNALIKLLDEKEGQVSLERLIAISIESLITQRYLDADDEFYSRLLNFYSLINTLNNNFEYMRFDPKTKSRIKLIQPDLIVAIDGIVQHLKEQLDKVNKTI